MGNCYSRTRMCVGRNAEDAQAAVEHGWGDVVEPINSKFPCDEVYIHNSPLADVHQVEQQAEPHGDGASTKRGLRLLRPTTCFGCGPRDVSDNYSLIYAAQSSSAWNNTCTSCGIPAVQGSVGSRLGQNVCNEKTKYCMHTSLCVNSTACSHFNPATGNHTFSQTGASLTVNSSSSRLAHLQSRGTGFLKQLLTHRKQKLEGSQRSQTDEIDRCSAVVAGADVQQRHSVHNSTDVQDSQEPTAGRQTESPAHQKMSSVHLYKHNSSSSTGYMQSGNIPASAAFTLLVSSHSHSHSSHQESPRTCERSAHSSSSTASNHDASTPFTSLPASGVSTACASPDGMLTALSSTSSCLSSHKCSSRPNAVTPAGVLAAATAAADSADSRAHPVQQKIVLSSTACKTEPSPKAIHEKLRGVLIMSTSTANSQEAPEAAEGHTQQGAGCIEPEARALQQQRVTSISFDAGVEASAAATKACAGQQPQPHIKLAHSPLNGSIQCTYDVEATPAGVIAHGPQQEHPQQSRPFWSSSQWSFGGHSEQNLRAYMEDRSVSMDLTGHPAFPSIHRAGLFSVYDGHGGHEVAEFLSQHIKSSLLASGAGNIRDQPLRALEEAVNDAERQLLASYADGDITAAAGSTLCAVLLIDDKLHVAHVGDSRAVLARGRTAKQLTRDHKPACEVEAQRILRDDPKAEITSDGYIYGELAVARAIGSAHLKRDPSKKALIATAEVATVQLEQQDDFVIVATDGLWDKVSSSEAVAVARRVLSDSKDATTASRALVERAQRCGSSDNISVVTLMLHDRDMAVPRSNSRLFKRPAAPAAEAGDAAC